MSFFSLFAQSTEGKEFWLTFGNVANIPMVPGNVNLFDMQIRIVGGSEATSGTIFFTELGTSYEFNIDPYEIYIYALEEDEKYAVYNTLSNGITDYSIRIVTLQFVSVYASINLTGMIYNDVSNVLPVTALGTEYYAISYKVFSAANDAYGVVATQNDTQLFINGVPVAILNAGQVFYKTSDNSNGLTGELVTSNKPIAFFALCKHTAVPEGGTNMLFQQLAPENTWGKTFFVPVTIVGKERIRIVASRNGTTITQAGGTIMTDSGGQPSTSNLQAGQFVELEIATGNSGCFFYANNSVGVCSFMLSQGNTNPLGACSQTWIPGIDQTTPKILIAPFALPNYSSHYALICTPTATRDNTSVSIGGATPVPLTGSWIANAASGMSYCNFLLTNISASYILSNPAGIIVLGYGLAGSATSAASYYYLAGSAMRDLQATFSANDISYQLLKENSICEGEVHFLAEIEGLHSNHPERLTWWIDSTEYLPAKNFDEWWKPFSVGEYEIEMKVRYENDETTSKTGTLIIKSCNQSAEFYVNDVHYLTDTTFCNKKVNFRAEIEGLHPTDPESIKWYVDGIEEASALNQLQWGKPFENGTYEIKMVAKYDNGETATRTGTLKVQALWIKMRNVKH
jgi:hypothetical protein